MSERELQRRSAYFAWCEVAQNPLLGCLPIVIIALLAGLLLPALVRFKAARAKSIIIYAAQDQVYSEPILEQFTKRTGIKVRAVYDSEAVKTVGLANRLLAEHARPQCDVFWGNEELRTRQLAAQNVFRETNGWTAFGYRSRRMVINTNLIAAASAPKNLLELTNAMWRGKVALAYPLFGTTATHFLALRQHWGATNWLAWCKHLQQNKPFLVDGNSVVVNLVGRGEAAIGLTDSDDVAAGQRNGLPIVALPLGAEGLLIPNTVAVVRGGPNPAAAQELYVYLHQPEIAQQLVAQNALESASSAAAGAPGLTPDWSKLLDDLDTGIAELQKLFLR